MISLEINKTIIPLPVDAKINREVETKIFTKSDEAYDFTFPVDIPLTRQARLALGFPDVLSNAVVNREYSGFLNISSPDGQYSVGALIIVLSVSKQNETCRLSILGQYAALKSAFGTKRVNDLTMGGPEFIEDFGAGFDDIEYTFSEALIKDGSYNYGYLKVRYSSGPVNSFMTKVAKGLITRDYLFPKGVDVAGNLPGASGNAIINAWDHKRDRYVDADLYNVMSHDWKYIPDINPPNAFANPDRHFWVPMYKFIRVLQYCFSEAGLTLTGSVLSDAKIEKHVLYNTHAINVGFEAGWMSPLTPDKHFKIEAGFPRAYIFPRNHLPDMEINEFINEISKRFNWQFDYDIANKTVNIKDDRTLSSAPTVKIDLTSAANPKPTINFERTDSYLNGYNIEFERDDNDAALSENVLDEIKGFRYRGVISKCSLASLAAIPSPLVKDYVYVRNTNSYYEYKGAVGWELMSHGIMPYKSTDKDNLQQIRTKIVSNPMQIVTVRMIDFFSGYGRVLTLIGAYSYNEKEPAPFSSIGMTFDRFGYLDWEDSNTEFYAPGIGHPWKPHVFQANKSPISTLPHLVNYLGLQFGMDSTEKYVMATSAMYNANGAYVILYSCSPGNPEGFSLYNDWWEPVAKLVANSFVVDYDVLIDSATYAKLKVNSTMVVIDNLQYLIKKANFIIPLPSIARLSLVRL